MICDNDQRRALVRAHRDIHGQPDMNGLDYVEVADDGKTLLAYFIGKLPSLLQTDRPALNKYLRIEGGRRVRGIQVLDVDLQIEDDSGRDDYLVITLDRPGDFSTYSLRLVGIQGIDPRYDHAEFSFKVDCPSDLDCALPEPCPPPQLDEPDINYLAKDYASFRQLLLDRLALIMPDWKERHVPDLGITLVELLAYAGDHLSYYQDAVATEAYLDTARQRISVRRHARLVDYFLHEGCNARAWLCLNILGKDKFELDLKDATFLALVDPAQSITRELLSQEEFRQLPLEAYEVFEPMLRSKITLRQAHNEIQLYTWGQNECCLPRGTTSASLLDGWSDFGKVPGDPAQEGPGKKPYEPADLRVARAGKQMPPERVPEEKPKLKRALDLQAGDVLIFEEVLGPKTGNPADADPARRVAVRLTKVTLNEDPVVMTKSEGIETMVGLPTPVLDIEWQAEDALPFALCLSSVTSAPDCQYLENVSVAHGNVILADQGRTLRPPEEVGTVPLDRSEAPCECEGQPGEATYQPGLFRPGLNHAQLTFRQSLPADDPANHKWVSAKSLMLQDPRAALPQVLLSEVPGAPDEHGGLVPLFKMEDLVDPTELVKRMLDPQDTFGATLLGKLTPGTQEGLGQLKAGEPPLPALLEYVRTDLKALLRSWESRFDLLSSGPDDLNFVVEMDNEALAHLRFGDNDLGERPPAGSAFYADYREGNGRRGNLGAEAITHIVINLSGANLRVRNPLPAAGGVDPEPMADAKLYAPSAFRMQLERAIIADDYARITQREFRRELQSAAARLAWTGSWYEAEVALDPTNAQSYSAELAQAISRRLDQYRRMGHDLRVETAQHVPLDIELEVCVKSGYLRGHVKAALLELFSNRPLPNGKAGFFHPDRLTFGEDIALSRIVAEAQAVEGVSSVAVTKLQRLFEAPNHEIENGLLPLGPFEIAQIDNDPVFPEHGCFTLVMAGGR